MTKISDVYNLEKQVKEIEDKILNSNVDLSDYYTIQQTDEQIESKIDDFNTVITTELSNKANKDHTHSLTLTETDLGVVGKGVTLDFIEDVRKKLLEVGAQYSSEKYILICTDNTGSYIGMCGWYSSSGGYDAGFYKSTYYLSQFPGATWHLITPTWGHGLIVKYDKNKQYVGTRKITHGNWTSQPSQYNREGYYPTDKEGIDILYIDKPITAHTLPGYNDYEVVHDTSINKITKSHITLQHAKAENDVLNQYIGKKAELIYNTDTNDIHVLDGVNAGGYALAKKTDLSNVDLSNYYTKVEADNKFADLKHSHSAYTTSASGKIIEINSDYGYKLNTYKVKGKTINNNGSLLSLGQLENNKLQFHNEENSLPQIKPSMQTLLSRCNHPDSKIIEKDGRPNCIYAFTKYNYRDSSDCYSFNMILQDDFAMKDRPYVLKFDMYHDNQRFFRIYTEGCKLRVDDGEWIDAIAPPLAVGWHTYEITNANTDNIIKQMTVVFGSKMNQYYGTEQTKWYLDYDSFSFMEKYGTDKVSFEIDIKEPLRSTLDGSVYDEFDGQKIVRRVKQVNDTIIVLDKEIIEFVNPRPFNIIKGKSNLIGILNKMDDIAIEIKYSKTQFGITEINNDDISLLKANQNLLFQSVSDGKKLLEAAIADKGIMVSKVGSVATFEELKTGVNSIVNEDLAGKRKMLDVIISKVPALDGVLTLENSLDEYAHYMMMIGPMNLAFRETVKLNDFKAKELIITIIDKPDIKENKLIKLHDYDSSFISEDATLKESNLIKLNLISSARLNMSENIKVVQEE